MRSRRSLGDAAAPPGFAWRPTRRRWVTTTLAGARAAGRPAHTGARTGSTPARHAQQPRAPIGSPTVERRRRDSARGFCTAYVGDGGRLPRRGRDLRERRGDRLASLAADSPVARDRARRVGHGERQGPPPARGSARLRGLLVPRVRGRRGHEPRALVVARPLLRQEWSWDVPTLTA